MSNCVTIGWWSVLTGHEVSSVLQLITASRRPLLQNTLLTLVWFPVLWECSVGMYAGKAIFMLC